MRVEEIMTKNVEACRPDDTLNTAADIMWQADCGCVPVVDGQSKRVIGMITDRDICMAAYLSGQPLQALTIEGAMAKTVHSCSPQDPLSVAERMMREGQIRRLPAVDDDGQLMGIISLSDIALTPTTRADEIAETIKSISKQHPSSPDRASDGS